MSAIFGVYCKSTRNFYANPLSATLVETAHTALSRSLLMRLSTNSIHFLTKHYEDFVDSL